jgi:hypothetical protein
MPHNVITKEERLNQSTDLQEIASPDTLELIFLQPYLCYGLSESQ